MIAIILLRSVKGKTATLAVLQALSGQETGVNWRKAFTLIPPQYYERIVALVSDDAPSLAALAHEQKWLHQVCTFHTKLRFYRRLPKRRQHTPETMLRWQIWQAVKTITDDPNPHRIGPAVRVLKKTAKTVTLPRQFQISASGLSWRWPSSRTYLTHPELHLPATSNAVESVASLVRELLSRHRGFRTIKALQQWLDILSATHPTIVCNGQDNIHN